MKVLIFLSFVTLLSFAKAMDAATAAELLELHNIERRKVGIAELQWDKSLESSAEKWAKNMASNGFRHSRTKGLGENIAKASFRDGIVPYLFDLWAREVKDFDPSKKYPACQVGPGEVGHYTQIMWSKTTHVGCGLADGGSSTNLVCQYKKPGNYINEYVYTSADKVASYDSSSPDTGSDASAPTEESTPTEEASPVEDSGSDNNDSGSSYTPKKSSSQPKKSSSPKKTSFRTSSSSSSS